MLFEVENVAAGSRHGSGNGSGQSEAIWRRHDEDESALLGH